MDLCLGFDDSDFKGKQKKGKQLFASYNAKICYQKWFQDLEDFDGQTENKATILKFKADYLYRHGQYTEAVPHYNEGIAALPSSNRIMRRELQESLSRCYIQMGDCTAALGITETLKQGSTTSAQVCHVLQIQQQVYNRLGKTQDEISVLEKLISMHQYNGHFWLRLGQAYQSLQHSAPSQMDRKTHNSDKADITDDVADRIAEGLLLSGSGDNARQSLEGVEEQTAAEKVTDADKDKLSQQRLMSLTCYVRVKLIFRSVHGTGGSFIKARNEEVLKQVDVYIQQITTDERIIKAATEHMKQDLHQEETEDGDDKTTDTDIQVVPSEDIPEFGEKWFSWIKNIRKLAE